MNRAREREEIRRICDWACRHPVTAHGGEAGEIIASLARCIENLTDMVEALDNDIDELQPR